MLAFIIRRLLQSAVVLLAMSLVIFFGVYGIGNPVDLLISPDADAIERARVISSFGLDQPVWWQYWLFLKNALAGDMGRSFVYGSPALGLILERLPATLELASIALVIAVGVGVPLGLWAGLRSHTFAGKSIMTVSILGFSLPTFWVGLMMIMLFSVKLGWLPTSGRGQAAEWLGITSSLFTLDGLRHLAMPAVNLALFDIALIIRLTRSGTREVLLQDYIKFSRAKGLSEGRIVGVHVLKNILIPIVTVCALQFGATLAFSIVTESIFAWPGMGKLLVDSIRALDRPVIVAFLSLIVGLFIVINLLVDLLYCLLDPRVRLTENKG